MHRSYPIYLRWRKSMCTEQNNTNNDSKQDPTSISKGKAKYLVDKYIVPIILSMVATLLYNTFSIHQINDRLIAIENSINNNNSININLNGLQTTSDGKISIKYDEQYLEASTNNNKIHASSNHDSERNNEETYDGVISSSAIQDKIIYSIDEPTWLSTDVIAINMNSGEKYTAKELANKKILLPYKLDNQECYFYGQFNENNQWDGDCIINIYEDDSLVSIMESKYEDGVLLAYKQVFQISRTNYDVWSFSDRINYSDYSTGKTWSYFKHEDYVKDFAYEDATTVNIFDVNSFESIAQNGGIEEYYYGRTSDGLFNDTTGDAYLVKYFEDGTTRLIYSGNFENGYPNDETDNAWNIAKAENTTYMYYKGHFKDNKVQNNPGCIFENYLTEERIEEILQENNWKDKHCEYELNMD